MLKKRIQHEYYYESDEYKDMVDNSDTDQEYEPAYTPEEYEEYDDRR